MDKTYRLSRLLEVSYCAWVIGIAALFAFAVHYLTYSNGLIGFLQLTFMSAGAVVLFCAPKIWVRRYMVSNTSGLLHDAIGELLRREDAMKTAKAKPQERSSASPEANV